MDIAWLFPLLFGRSKSKTDDFSRAEGAEAAEQLARARGGRPESDHQ